MLFTFVSEWNPHTCCRLRRGRGPTSRLLWRRPEVEASLSVTTTGLSLQSSEPPGPSEHDNERLSLITMLVQKHRNDHQTSRYKPRPKPCRVLVNLTIP